MGVLGAWAFSYGRGTPVNISHHFVISAPAARAPSISRIYMLFQRGVPPGPTLLVFPQVSPTCHAPSTLVAAPEPTLVVVLKPFLMVSPTHPRPPREALLETPD